MSYEVLARKWRPRSFPELVGQEHVRRALVNALDSGRLHHAYLFTGTRGVGKTTMARILAKCLNCETKGVTSEPCGECSACREVDEGRFVDLIEVDAASRTKVDETRELLENVPYAPTRGRYKVYLIDEVHMLSGHSFNALLKTLEEPPPHVKFLLATTDPQKLPVTVLSRCLQFNLKNLNAERIVSHLQHVLEQEKIPFEETALRHLARAADGSMRDALSLTDQAIAHGGGTLTAAEVNTMLGTIDHSAVIDICRAVAAGDAPTAMDEVERLSEHAPDYQAALAELLSLWHRVAIAQTVPDALDPVQEHRDQILELAATLNQEDVQLYYQITLLGRRDLPWAADPRSGFEMVLLRLLAFRPELPDQSDGERPSPAASAGGEVRPPAKKPDPVAPTAPRAQVAETVKSTPEPAAASPSAPVPPAAVDTPEPGDRGGAQPPADAPRTPPDSGNEGQSPDGSVGQGESAAPEPPPLPSDYETWAGADDAPPPGATDVEQPRPDPQPEPAPEPEPAPVVEPPPSRTRSVDTREGAGAATPAVAFENLRPEDWQHVCRDLGQGGLLGSIAVNTVLTGVEDETLHFDLDESNSALYEQEHEERLAAALTDYFGRPVRVRIRVAPVDHETPRMIGERQRAERRQAAVESLRTDPNVQTLCRVFGAELVESSVRPTEAD